MKNKIKSIAKAVVLAFLIAECRLLEFANHEDRVILFISFFLIFIFVDHLYAVERQRESEERESINETAKKTLNRDYLRF